MTFIGHIGRIRTVLSARHVHYRRLFIALSLCTRGGVLSPPRFRNTIKKEIQHGVSPLRRAENIPLLVLEQVFGGASVARCKDKGEHADNQEPSFHSNSATGRFFWFPLRPSFLLFPDVPAYTSLFYHPALS